MINLMRKYQQGLMIVITFLVIIAFVWLYNGRTVDRVAGPQSIGRIYGRSISQTEAQHEARKFGIAQSLQLIDLESALIGQASSQNEAVFNFVVNSIVLRHESELLQIAPTQEEVKVAIMGVPAFQTGNAFDSDKYNRFSQDYLAPNGMSAVQFEELMGDDLRLRKIKELLNATFEISPAVFRTVYMRSYQKMDVSLIRFNLGDFEAKTSVTDADIKNAFDQRKDGYKSEEKRRIKVATFSLTVAEMAFTGKERIDALQKLSDRANDMTQAMLDKNAKFDDVAAKFSLPVIETQPFAESAPDPKIAQLPGVASAAFRLTKSQPDSDALQGENGFYVAHLEEIVPARPLTLEEAKPQIATEIKNNRSHEALSLKASEIRNKIQASIKSGTSFPDAAKAAGVQVESFPPFSLAEPDLEKPDSREIIGRASELSEGQMSDFVPVTDGGLLVHLDKREPIDDSKIEKDKALLGPRLVQQELKLVFAEWLRKQREGAHIEIAHTASQR